MAFYKTHKKLSSIYEYLLSNDSNIIGNMYNSIYLVFKGIKQFQINKNLKIFWCALCGVYIDYYGT